MKNVVSKSPNLFPLCLIIFFLINHFSNYQILHFDGNGYIALALSIFYLICQRNTYNIKPYLLNKTVVIWAVLMTYHIVNSIWKGVTEGLVSQSIVPVSSINVLLMALCSYDYVLNKKKLLWTIFVSLAYYLLVAYNFTTITDDRLSGFLYTTQLGQMSGVLCIVISLLISEKKNFLLSFLYVFPVFMMILAGSRNGLLTVLYAFAVLAIPYVLKNKSSIIFIVLFAVIFYHFLQVHPHF